VLTAQGALKELRAGGGDDPNLYDVYTMLKVDGKVVDVEKHGDGLPQDGVQGRRGHGRRVYQRQVRLSEGICAALGG
jgi:beta-galactosidase